MEVINIDATNGAWLQTPMHLDDGGGEGGDPAPSLPYSYPSVMKSISVQFQPRTPKKLRRPKKFELSLLSLREVPRRLDDSVDGVRVALAEQLRFGVASSPVVTQLAAVAAYGAEQVRLEFARQGVTLAPTPVPALDEDAAALAALATMQLQAIFNAWLEKVLKRGFPDATGHRVIEAAMTRETPRVCSKLAGHAVNNVYAFGRKWQQAHRQGVVHFAKGDADFPIDLEEIDVVQTNVMDAATCIECEKVNGEVFDYGSSRQLELEPPYILCLGEERCRCEQIALIKGQHVDIADVTDEELEDMLQMTDVPQPLHMLADAAATIAATTSAVIEQQRLARVHSEQRLARAARKGRWRIERDPVTLLGTHIVQEPEMPE